MPIGVVVPRTIDAVIATVAACRRHDVPVLPRGEDKILIAARKQLDRYFAGSLKAFDLPLAPEGTVFQQKVWAALLTIPYGATRSYAQQAIAIGNPKATRAVGLANGRNPIAIIDATTGEDFWRYLDHHQGYAVHEYKQGGTPSAGTVRGTIDYEPLTGYVAAITHQNFGTGSILHEVDYGHDDNGNVDSVFKSSPVAGSSSESYIHDHLNRLTHASQASGPETHS